MAAGFPKIKRAEQAHWYGKLWHSIILLLGDEGIDHGGMLVGVAIVLIMLVRHGMVIVFVTGGGMRPVTVIHHRDLLLATAIAHETAMEAKRLRPAHREQRDEAKGETLQTKKRHDSQMITSLRRIMQPRIQSAAVWRCFSSTSALRIFTRFIS